MATVYVPKVAACSTDYLEPTVAEPVDPTLASTAAESAAGSAAEPSAPVAPVQVGPAGVDSAGTIFDVMVEQLLGQGRPAHSVWLPPLTSSSPMDALLPGLTQLPGLGLQPADWPARGTMRAAIGIVDRPYEQRLDPLWIDLAGAGGNVGLVGAPQSGESTILRALISGFALTHTTEQVQFYCLDFGGGALAILERLPHVGGVAARLAADAVRRTVAELAEDHLFLHSGCQRCGLWYSKAGNGVSHPTHMQRFGVPGKTMVGSDSHTPAAGSLGMPAIGVGGLEVALAMAGRPLFLTMPQGWGVELAGALPRWCSAKDVILEMLRRHGVKGAVNKIIEYHGPGLASLTAMDRHVIANMGAELGATTTVFPADDAVRDFLRAEQREGDFTELRADDGAEYDLTEHIDLDSIVPLIATPSSPGNVVTVREVAGRPISQVVVGSSANPGLRDFAIVAAMVKGRQTSDVVSFDVNPTSRQILQDLTKMGSTFDLIAAGARIHQVGCMGCIGIGQAPAVGHISLRTVPRNFPGRSGTKEDAVYLCSPETAAASALAGVITDPRDLAEKLGLEYPDLGLPATSSVNTAMLVPPLPPQEAAQVELVRGSNISALPDFDPLPNQMSVPVLLKMGDNVSTDEISPAGAQALPFRSNVPKLAEFSFIRIDDTYPERARAVPDSTGHVVIAGENYGQGSSREHAAIAPRYLGLRLVIAKSFARIHWQNLANFGILAVEFANPADYDTVDAADVLVLTGVRDAVVGGNELTVRNETKGTDFVVTHRLSTRQQDYVLAGGQIPLLAQQARA